MVKQVQKRLETSKIIQEKQENPKIFGSVKTPSNAPKCIRLHPNASERVRTHPNGSEHVQKRPQRTQHVQNGTQNAKRHARQQRHRLGKDLDQIVQKLCARKVTRRKEFQEIHAHFQQQIQHPRAKI